MHGVTMKNTLFEFNISPHRADEHSSDLKVFFLFNAAVNCRISDSTKDARLSF